MGWHMLGEAFRLGGNPAAALPAYRRAIKLLPDWPQPYGGMASTLAILGRHAEGLPYMEKAIELAPSETLFQTMRFGLHFQPELTAAEITARHRTFRAFRGDAEVCLAAAHQFSGFRTIAARGLCLPRFAAPFGGLFYGRLAG